MKLVMKNFWQLLTKKETIKNQKKPMEWWIVQEVIQKNLIWLKKIKNRHWWNY